MKKNIYIIPKFQSYVDSVQPHIYYPTKKENVDSGFIMDLFRDNALVFEIIDDKYYPLYFSNYQEETNKIKENSRYKFTKEEIKEIENHKFGNYIPKIKEDDDLEELISKLTLSGSISGETSTSVEAEVSFKIENDTFKQVNQGDDIKSWFNGNSLGSLTANVKSNPEESNTKLTITIAGTSEEEINKQTKVTIPAEKLTSGKSLESNNEITIKITQKEEVVATVNATGDITGNTSTPISKEVVLKLSNDTFKDLNSNDDVKSWFVDDGSSPTLGSLTANVKSNPEESNSKLTITIAGTSEEEINKQTKVTIPAEKLTSGKSLESNKINISISTARNKKQK